MRGIQWTLGLLFLAHYPMTTINAYCKTYLKQQQQRRHRAQDKPQCPSEEKT